MKLALTLAAILAAGPALAAGDAAKGEKDFAKCRACHSIVNGDQVIQKGGKVGPNLYGVVGRVVGSEEGYAYGSGLLEAKETGMVWDEDKLVEYLADPSAFIEKITSDSAARSKMTFKLKNGADVAAYLASLQ